MTIRMDKRRVVIEEEEDESSSEEQLSSEDELSDTPDAENTANKTDSDEESSDSENIANKTDSDEASDTEETPTSAKKARLDQSDEEEEEDDDDGDDEGSDVNSDNDDTEGVNANTAWADSIAKILKTNKPKKKKTLVLSKAKKLTDPVKEKVKPAGYEIATADGEIKEEKIIEKKDETKEESDKLPRKKKKDVLSFRVKPSILNKDRERLLSKIATKGVVQLFNAVKTQQKDITSKLESAGPLELKRDKVLKSVDKDSFLNVLMGEKSTQVNEALSRSKNTKTKVEEEGKASWNVLRDDFMMGAKMKDWDKELEGDDEEEEEVEMESD